MDTTNLIYLIISFAIAISVHESAHALAAYWLGDPTAKKLGRITLNPLRHLDPMGTILIFFVGFGWGKPVPVDSRYFKDPKRDNAIVSFAGPLSNIALALMGFLFIKYWAFPESIFHFFELFISLNLILAVFNLIPIPPLDGSNVLEAFLPKSLHGFWEGVKENGPFLLLALLLAEHFFQLGFLAAILRFGTDFLYVFLWEIS
jgi:Zn-dependent protease